MSDRVTHLFRDLKSKYDYIIVDTAPVGIVSDTLLISKYADTVVYVVRAHQLPRKMLNIASDLKAEERLPNMAILLNGTYGNKGYGYGYGGMVTDIQVTITETRVIKRSDSTR